MNYEDAKEVLSKIFASKTHTLGIGMLSKQLSYLKSAENSWSLKIIPHLDEPIYTVSTKLETEANALEFIKELTAKVDVSAHSNRISVDITAKGVSKESGIDELSQILQISKDEIFVIGDSLNDVSMIKAYNGYTVHNALDEVKAISQAAFIDVGEMIEKVILSK